MNFLRLILGRLTTITGIFSVLLIASESFTLQAQRSYGGKPLSIGEEIAYVRSMSDYMIEMPAFDVDSLLREDSVYHNPNGALRFAHKLFVNLSPENSGVLFHLQDGTKIWKLGLRSPGAYSLNIIFEDFVVPAGAKLFLYNPEKTQVLGAFNRNNMQESGEFAISPVEGDELLLEYHEPADAAFPGKLRLTEVNHDYRGLMRLGARFDELNLPCIPELSCDARFETIGRSVCLLILNGTTYCTGAFINNTTEDGRPFLLTASHCLENNPALAGRTVVFMNYLSPRCMAQIRGSEEFSLSGCQARALSNEADFALMELNEIIPPDYRLFLSGWSLDTAARFESPFTCIHHPYGEGKRFALSDDSLLFVSWPYASDGIAPDNHWSVKQWKTGHTWKGSSGAPLLNNKHQLIGLLTGGDSGGDNGCGPYQLGDFFVRFQQAWDSDSDSTKQLKYWLDPLSSNVLTLNGLDPNKANPARRISNIRSTDSIAVLRQENTENGYLFGHNSLGQKTFAEEFRQDSLCMLKGVYLIPYIGIKSSTYPVYIDILEGGHPSGRILSTALINPYYIEYRNRNFHQTSKVQFANRENYIAFDPPVSVGRHFYVAFRIDYAADNKTEIDSFALYAAYNKGRTFKNTVWINNGKSWEFYSDLGRKNYSSSLWLEPLLMRDTLSVTEPGPEDSLHQEIPLYYSSQDRMMHIKLPSSWRLPVEIRIFDLPGRLHFLSSSFEKNWSFYLPERFKGVYIIQLKEQRRHYVQKIVF